MLVRRLGTSPKCMDENMDNRPSAIVCADAPSRSTTGDLRGHMCSVVDSSMSVHFKASGNFLLFGDSEGGDTKRLGGSQY